MPGPHAQLADALAGRYTIAREVGAGGMATVFLARDIKHDRDVALKVLRPELEGHRSSRRGVRQDPAPDDDSGE